MSFEFCNILMTSNDYKVEIEDHKDIKKSKLRRIPKQHMTTLSSVFITRVKKISTKYFAFHS
jgi:hypothetical protein